MPSRPQRVHSLDGLRGIAAVIVLVYHSLLTNRLLALPAQTAGTRLHGWAYALTYTPLHLVWDGSEAVVVFFVLSGYVLTLPFDRAKTDHWRSFYPRRIVRLYLPIWGAVVIATVLAVAVPRTASNPSWWVNHHAGALSPLGVVRDLVVLLGTNWIDSPLWSMRWEIAFSLLLPVYLFFALRWRRAALVNLAVLAAAVAVGTFIQFQALEYLPVFAIGCCLAAYRERIASAAFLRRRAVFWAALVIALLMLNASWISPSVNGGRVSGAIAAAVVALGAALLVVLFSASPQARSVGESRVVQWLARISFSLYLIHEPIIVTFANLWPSLNAAEILVISALVAIPVAWLFFRAVEAPVHALSKRVGTWFEGRASRRDMPAPIESEAPVG